MSESAPAIIAAVVVAAVGGYLGYRVCKEKQRLQQVVTLLGPTDMDLIQSIEELVVQAKLLPSRG